MAQLEPKCLAQLEPKWVAQLRPFYLSGDQVECYISFINANESVASDSLHVARVLVA